MKNSSGYSKKVSTKVVEYEGMHGEKSRCLTTITVDSEFPFAFPACCEVSYYADHLFDFGHMLTTLPKIIINMQDYMCALLSRFIKERNKVSNASAHCHEHRRTQHG